MLTGGLFRVLDTRPFDSDRGVLPYPSLCAVASCQGRRIGSCLGCKLAGSYIYVLEKEIGKVIRPWRTGTRYYSLMTHGHHFLKVRAAIIEWPGFRFTAIADSRSSHFTLDQLTYSGSTRTFQLDGA